MVAQQLQLQVQSMKALLDDKHEELEAYKTAMDNSEMMLIKLEQEQSKAQQASDSEILELSNKVKFLEG